MASIDEKIAKLFTEVTYHKGEVVSDPQTWAETSVSSSGGGRNKAANISSSTTTWTSFVIKKENGKEYLVKFPNAFAARQGNTVVAADFRGSTIAAANDVTDTMTGTENVVASALQGKEFRAFHPLVSYGVGFALLAICMSLVVPLESGGIAFLPLTWPIIVWTKRLITHSRITTALPNFAQKQLKKMLT